MSKKIPLAVEELILSLNNPGNSRILRETKLSLIENSIEAMQKAVNEYKASQKKVAKR